MDDGGPASEVEALLLRGEIAKAVDILMLEIEYDRAHEPPSCAACDKTIGHQKWCPLRYWG